jgi:predicted  nucleic acid-binding Zn-ribbon protein
LFNFLIFKVKLQNNDDSASALASLNMTISEQRNKILEKEEVVEKLRSQRERMLNKMKEMKINNETLTNQVSI